MFEEMHGAAVDVTELLVATPEQGDPGLEPCVHEMLQLVREKTRLQTVFVRAARPNGEPADLALDALAARSLEAAWGEHVLGNQLSGGEAATCIHQSAPVALADGSVYGTLCVCSRDQWMAQTEANLLRSTAMLIAQKIDGGRRPLLAVHRSRLGDLRFA